jgi:hypothetical protein
MWLIQTVIVVPGFTVIRLAQAVAIRIGRSVKSCTRRR